MTETTTAPAPEQREVAAPEAPATPTTPSQIAHALAGTTFTLLTSAASSGSRYVGKANVVGGYGVVGANAHHVRLQILEATPRLLREVVDALDVRLPPLGGGDRGMRRAIIALGQLTERAEAAGHTELADKVTRFLTRARSAAMSATGEAHLTPYRWRAHADDQTADAQGPEQTEALVGAGAEA
ncbi:hypothetical protein [Cellulosimicrobium sp. Marseille-Q4280]|uniref:hypothetical protein n=1 Tax=Cellulosimicrobium sp. Marseille-Q4280 TaxID=2937992 RepID=UPI00203DE4C8|nr:hypothetical protein [Cellulosimicrobium sp. Marseille-Q4280]